MKNKILILNLFLIVTSCFGQIDSLSSDGIIFHVNKNVRNSETDYFKEIVNNWKNYLNSQEYVRRENTYWDQSNMAFPDYSYVSLLMELRAIINSNEDIHVQ